MGQDPGEPPSHVDLESTAEAFRVLGLPRRLRILQLFTRSGTWVHYRLPEDPAPDVAPVLRLVTALPLDAVDEARLTLRLDFRERTGCVLGVGDPTVLASLDGIAADRQLTVLP